MNSLFLGERNGLKHLIKQKIYILHKLINFGLRIERERTSEIKSLHLMIRTNKKHIQMNTLK